MISRPYDVEHAPAGTLGDCRFEEIEWAERIARSLDEANGSAELEQHLITERSFAGGAHQGVPEAHVRKRRLFERDMTADASSHALPDQDRLLTVDLFAGAERRDVAGDEDGVRVRPLAACALVG